MTEEITVSFIVPFIKVKPLLKEVIKSIQNQNIALSFEIILVDDRKWGVTPSFKGIKNIKSRGGGPSVARNKGASIAVGKFLAFVDSDVILEPNWLMECLNELQKFPGIAAVQAPVTTRSLNHEFPSFLDRYRIAYKKWVTNQKDLYFNESGFVLNTASVLCRKKAFEKVNGFDEKLRRAEDYHFTMKLLFQGYFLSTTLKTRAYVYHDRGIVAYVRKYIRQGQAERSLSLVGGVTLRPSLKNFETTDKSFRLFRNICQLAFRCGTYLFSIKLEKLNPVFNKTNLLLGLNPNTRLLYGEKELYFLNILEMRVMVLETEHFDWSFPLKFRSEIINSLKENALVM